MKNVIITPHLAGYNDEYPKRALPVLKENIRRFLAGDTMNMVNLVEAVKTGFRAAGGVP